MLCSGARVSTDMAFLLWSRLLDCRTPPENSKATSSVAPPGLARYRRAPSRVVMGKVHVISFGALAEFSPNFGADAAPSPVEQSPPKVTRPLPRATVVPVSTPRSPSVEDRLGGEASTPSLPPALSLSAIARREPFGLGCALHFCLQSFARFARLSFESDCVGGRRCRERRGRLHRCGEARPVACVSHRVGLWLSGSIARFARLSMRAMAGGRGGVRAHPL